MVARAAKARGVPVEFVTPKEGAIAFKTTIHIVKNSPNKELAFKLIEAALSPEVRDRLVKLGADPVGHDARQFAVLLERDLALWRKVALASGIKVE